MKQITEEQWKRTHVRGDIYRVSNHGRVKSLSHGIKSQGLLNGYRKVELCVDGAGKTLYVHRLVLTAFTGPPPTEAHQCNHIDGDKANNHISNLEWVTQSENIHHALDTGLNGQRGSEHTKAKLNEDRVLEMRERYWTCGSVTQRELADEYGVGQMTVSNALRGITWKHANGPTSSIAL